MELRLPHMLHLFNVFGENDGKENCAQVLEEECIKMFGTKSLSLYALLPFCNLLASTVPCIALSHLESRCKLRRCIQTP